jgi:antitoxin YefM
VSGNSKEAITLLTVIHNVICSAQNAIAFEDLNVHLDVQMDLKTMLSNLPITEARHELTSLPEKLTQQGGALAITRRGKPVLAVMTWQHYEAILETLEIYGDPNLMTNLRQGIAEAKSEQGLDWESSKQELAL